MTFPELAAVEAAATALDAWKKRASEQESTHCTLEDLEKLLEDASGLSVMCSELHTLTQTVTSAQTWIAQVCFSTVSSFSILSLRSQPNKYQYWIFLPPCCMLAE